LLLRAASYLPRRYIAVQVMNKYFTIIILISILSSCYTQFGSYKSEISSQPNHIVNVSQIDTIQKVIQLSDCDTVVTLTRTSCYGTCPDFKVALLSNSKLYFNGKRFVKKIGFCESNFNEKYLRKLVRNIKNSGFMNLRDKYSLSNCNGYLDSPSIGVYIKTNKDYKYVSFYLGCTDYSNEREILLNIANEIEAIPQLKELLK
jgi:hypothetical protein